MSGTLLALEGKVALVSGAGAGIGRAIAEAYAEAGMQLALAEIDPERVDGLRAALPAALVLQADVREERDVAAVAAAVRDCFGKLDVLVNNVGDYLDIQGRFEDSIPEQWQRLYAVNLHHVFLMTVAALPLMRASGAGGSIVNVSTVEVLRGIPYFAAYAAFKAALTGFTQSLAVELGAEDIRVNAIAPDTTDTSQIVAAARVPEENRALSDSGFRSGASGAQRTPRAQHCFSRRTGSPAG